MADFDTLKDWVVKDWRAQSKWREAAAEDFAFVAGHQWTDKEQSAMLEQARVPLVFNRVAVIISSIVGSEINNRTEVRFIPRTIGDAKPNEVLTAGAEWFRDQANAEDEESEAFEDCVICGLGVTETTLDFEADDEGEPRVIRHDPIEFAWDCHAHRKALQDAQRVHRVREIALREAKEMFPGKESAALDAVWLDKGDADDGEHVTYADDQYSHGKGIAEDERRDTVKVIQTQWCESEKVVEFAMPGAEKPVEMTPGKWDRLEKMGVTAGIPARRITRKVWRQAFLGRDGILMQNQPDPENCTFQFMTGHYDRKDKRFYGILKNMKDPQKFANKWLSQVLHIINSNAKGGVMVEVDAVDDHREFEDSWAAADSVNWLKPGTVANGKIQPKPVAQMPAALMSLTEYAVSSIRDVSGVNLELLGLRDANQPGVLEYQRRQSAMTTLSGFFDALRFYRKRQGRVILNFLRNHIAPTGRLVRLVEDGDARYVPMAMADDTAKYDVIVDDAPQAPNQKERNWEIIQQILPVFADKLDADDWAMVAEYSPLPTAFVERIKAKAGEQKDAGPDPMQQLAMAKEQSEIKKNEATATKTMAEAQQLGAPDDGMAKAQAGLMMDAQRHRQDMAQDAQRHEFDLLAKARENAQKLEMQRRSAAMKGQQ